MTIKTDGPRTKSRKLWDKHGSWLILVVVAGFAFNGGAEWQTYKDQKSFAVLIKSHVDERDALRVRLRLVNDQLKDLSRQMGPAVESAATASQDANKAIQKADETIDKATKLIEATQ